MPNREVRQPCRRCAYQSRTSGAPHAGSGIKRMRDVMRAQGLDAPAFEADDHWFSIIFKRKPQHTGLGADSQNNHPNLAKPEPNRMTKSKRVQE